jgi:hypothetical protein
MKKSDDKSPHSKEKKESGDKSPHSKNLQQK